MATPLHSINQIFGVDKIPAYFMRQGFSKQLPLYFSASGIVTDISRYVFQATATYWISTPTLSPGSTRGSVRQLKDRSPAIVQADVTSWLDATTDPVNGALYINIPDSVQTAPVDIDAVEFPTVILGINTTKPTAGGGSATEPELLALVYGYGQPN